MSPSPEIAVVGAGAAGLMASISACRRRPGTRVWLYDGRPKVGAKILISGGTRCNVTNSKVSPSDYHGAAPHFIRHVLSAFTPEKTRAFFEGIGVPLILEPTGKYFPVTHSGKTVLEALLNEASRQGVRLVTGVKITGIRPEDGGFVLESASGEMQRSHRVILATGGLSLPETGSEGTGLRIARSLGHTLVPDHPALTPLLTDDRIWQGLSGVTLEARLSCYRDGRKFAEAEGSFLFTHFGYSGPAALDLSRHVSSAPSSSRCRVEASFLPADTEETLSADWRRFAARHPSRRVKTFLCDEKGLPLRFVDAFLEKRGIDPTLPAGRLTRLAGPMVHALLHCDLAVRGVYGYKKAEATAGGVDLKEVRVQTMGSRKVPGLYLAGEILDVDGRIGGFNFQWAWSSGWVAGAAAAESLS